MTHKLPRVTEVIAHSFPGLVPDYELHTGSRVKCELGEEVHKLCKLVANKRELPASPYYDYARIFIRWLQETRVEVLCSETKIKGSYRSLPYTGTPDMVVRWAGKTWVIDIKTGSTQPWHQIQTAAYAWAWHNSCRTNLRDYLPRRAVLVLSAHGAKLTRFIDALDYRAWDACLTYFYWARRNLK